MDTLHNTVQYSQWQIQQFAKSESPTGSQNIKKNIVLQKKSLFFLLIITLKIYVLKMIEYHCFSNNYEINYCFTCLHINYL